MRIMTLNLEILPLPTHILAHFVYEKNINVSQENYKCIKKNKSVNCKQKMIAYLSSHGHNNQSNWLRKSDFHSFNDSWLSTRSLSIGYSETHQYLHVFYPLCFYECCIHDAKSYFISDRVIVRVIILNLNYHHHYHINKNLSYFVLLKRVFTVWIWLQTTATRFFFRHWCSS